VAWSAEVCAALPPGAGLTQGLLYYALVVDETGEVSERVEQRRVLGSLESEVMELLWAADGARSVREVLEGLNAGRRPPLAYTTVMTVLARLAEKGALVRTPAGRGFVYAPAVGDEAGIAVRGVVRDYGEAALAPFVEQAKADPKLYRRLRRLMEEDGR
jgi:predicted transcriptional regulator